MGDDAVAVFYRGDGKPFGIELAIFAPVPDFALPFPGRLYRVPHLAVESRIVAPGFEDARILADHLCGGIAGTLGECLVYPQDHAIGIGDHQYLLRLEGHGCDAQFGLILLAPGDVPDVRDNNFTVPEFDKVRGYIDRKNGAILAPVYGLESERALLPGPLPVAGPHLGRQFGIDIGYGHRQQLFPRIAALAAGVFVHVDNTRLLVDPEDAVGCMVADELGDQQLVLDLLAIADIEKEPYPPKVPAVAAAQQGGVALQRPAVAQFDLGMIVQVRAIV